MKKWISVWLIALLLTGCARMPASLEPQTTFPQAGQIQQAAPDLREPAGQTQAVTANADFFSHRDLEGTYDGGAAIILAGTSATSDSQAVQISGSTVTITREGTFLLSGSLNDGCIVVDAGNKDKVQLVLMDARIHCETAAALCIRNADKVFLTLAEGTQNTLSNGGSFDTAKESNEDAAVFSKSDLTINGNGSLYVLSPGGNGITSKDELTITGGVFTVDAESHGLEGKDCVCIAGGDFLITAGKDGIHSENDDDTARGYVYLENGVYDIRAQDDGISAGAWLEISGGSFAIAAGDDGVHADENLKILAGSITVTESYEGLEALGIDILGGNIRIAARDDGINAAGGNDQSGFGDGGGSSFRGSAGYIAISGGELAIQAFGDGIDANGSLSITGGYVILCGPTSGDTAVLDYDTTGTISGGTFIGTGAYRMVQTFSDSKGQGVVAVPVGDRDAGTKITLTDPAGNVILEHTPALAYQIVILSSPDIQKGKTYTITVGAEFDSLEAS